MPLPNITGENLKKPLTYDPARDKFITYEDIVQGREPIIPLDRLTPEQKKRLVIERQKRIPGSTVQQSISGPPYRPNEVIAAIERDEPFGKMTVEADISYLQELLEQIQAELKKGEK